MPKQRYKTARRGRRRLATEILEPRLLLANDLAFQNAGQPFDVNRDLRVSALDALQVINFFSRNGVGVQLPAENNSDRLPDVNGSNTATALDALQIINRLGGTQKLLAARLVNDSAPGGRNLDFQTNQYALEFGLTFGDGGEQLELRVDADSEAPFLPVSGTLGEDALLVDQAAIDTIVGAALSDGEHLFEARIAGQSAIQQFSITVDRTPPARPSSLGITADTDSGSVGDNVTNVSSPKVVVQAETGDIVTLLVDEQIVATQIAESPVEFTLDSLDDGDYRAQARLEDAVGNTTVSPVAVLRIDTVAPSVVSNLPAVFIDSPQALTISLGEIAGLGALETSNYLLRVIGGPSDGQLIEITSVDASIPEFTRLALAQPLGDGNYRLSLQSGIDDLAGNTLADAQQIDFSVVDPPRIETYAPADGEQLSSLVREVVVHFDEPIDPSTVTADSVQVIAAGDRIDGTLRVSRNERTVTLFHSEPFPASSLVRIMVDGDQIVGRDALAVDADGDGQPGGQGVAEFETLSMTPIAGTSVFGFLLDSTRDNPDGTPVPISGATITVEGLPEISTTTDASGFFELADVPAPELFIEIDARNSPAPDGFSYGKLRKPLHSEAGRRIQLTMDGQTFDMHLPLIPESDFTPLSATETTSAGFGPSALATLAEIAPDVPVEMWEDLRVDVEPNTIFFDDGTPATGVTVIPLAPDRIPAPLPPEVDPKIVFTVDAGGAENVDGRATLVYPNVDNLAPGEKRFIYSFDHDAGEWVTTGTMTVTADGERLESDPESGVQTLGWRGSGSKAGNKVSGSAKGVKPGPLDRAPEFFGSIALGVDLGVNAGEIAIRALDRAASTAGNLSPVGLVTNGTSLAFNSVAAIADGEISTIESVAIASDLLGAFAAAGGTIALLAGAVPGSVAFVIFGAAGTVAAVVGLTADIVAAKEIGESLAEKFPGDDPPCGILPEGTPTGDILLTISDCHARSASGLDELANATIAFEQQIVPLIRELIVPGLENRYADFINQQFVIAAGELPDSIRLLDLDRNVVAADDGRLDIPASEVIADATVTQQLIDAAQSFDADVFQQSAITVVEDRPNIIGAALENSLIARELFGEVIERISVPIGNAHYRITSGQLVVRGTTDEAGNFSEVLPPNQDYTIEVYDPVTGFVSTRTATTGGSGGTSPLGLPLFLAPTDTVDDDGDGIGNLGEAVLGTAPDRRDTDGDGVSDLAEAQSRLNPLDGLTFPTGIIAAVDLKGEAHEVVIEGSTLETAGQTAYVATGSHGIAIVDTSEFNSPILLGELELPGKATDVAANTRLGIAAVATGSAGLQIIDITDPLMPRLAHNAVVAAAAVEMFGGTIYASGIELTTLDASTGEVLSRLDLGAPVVDLAREGQRLAVITNDQKLHVVDVTSGSAVAKGSVDLPDRAVKVFLGGNVAYVSNGSVSDFRGSPRDAFFGVGGYSTVDISDPESPVVLSGVDTPNVESGNLKTVANGSGLALSAGGFHGLEVLSATDLVNTFDFLTNFPTPGQARSVAVAGGIAFMADGDAGLQVINYADFDTAGSPPGITISSDAIDVDATTAGIQVEEGTTISVIPIITDDVQVRNAELLVNGNVISNDVAFPFDFAAPVPELTSEVSSMSIQVRATDTGGNRTLSSAIELEIIPDITLPILADVSPTDRALIGSRAVQLRFNEPINVTAVDLASVTMVNLAELGVTIAPESVTFRGDDRVAQFNFPPLVAGSFELIIVESDFVDRAGNALGTAIDRRAFDAVDATAVWISPEGGFWDDVDNWQAGVLPGPDDGVLIVVNDGAEVIHRSGATDVSRLTVQGGFRLTGGSFNAGSFDVTDASVSIDGGNLRNTVIDGDENSEPLSLGFGLFSGVVLNVPAEVRGFTNLQIENGLTLNDTLTIATDGRTTIVEFLGTQTLGGTGTVRFAGNPNDNTDNRLWVSGDGAVLTIADGITVGLGRGTVRGNGAGAAIDLRGRLTPGPNPEDVVVAFDLTNDDGTLNLDAPDGRLIIATSLKDLTVTGTAGTQLEMGGSGITLDNVTLDLPALIKDAQKMTIENGLTLNDTLTISTARFATDLEFLGTQTLDGVGTVLFGGTPNDNTDNRLLVTGDDAVLTIAEGITVGLGRGRVFGDGDGAMIDLKGRLTPGPGASDFIEAFDLTNSDGTLNLDAPDGRLIIATSLKDLTVTGTAGTQLEMGGSGITLDNVTLDLPALIKDAQKMLIENGLTLNDTLTISTARFATDLEFLGTQTLDGVGTVLFGGTPNDNTDNRLLVTGDDAVLTIAEGITVGLGRGRVFGDGDGAMIDLKGRLTPGPGASDFIEAFDLTNSDGTLNLDAPDGRLIIATLLTDLTVTGTAGTQLEMGGSGITLDNVTLDLPALIKDAQKMTIENGLTLNDTLTISTSGFASDLDFLGTQILDGTGTVLFGGTPNDNTDNRLLVTGDDAVLTIASGITVGQGRGSLLSIGSGASIVMLGRLHASLGAVVSVADTDLSAGSVVVEIGDGAVGRVVGAGSFALPTLLQIDRPTGFIPTPGQRIDIFGFASLSGAIDQILGDEFDGIRLDPIVDEGTLSLLAESV